MALSERERHELARLEEQLKTEDPKLAQAFSAAELRNPVKGPLVFCLTLIAVGIIVLIAGIAASVVILSLAGIIVAASGITWWISDWFRSRYAFYGEELRQ